MKQAVVFLMLLIVSICFSACTAFMRTDAGDSPVVAKKTDEAPRISVTVTAAAPGGERLALEKLAVFLCAPDVVPAVKRVRKTGKLLAGKKGDYGALVADMPFIKGRIDSAQIAVSETDLSGRCVFEPVAPGEYVLCGIYRREGCAGYWMLPVSLQESTALDVSLLQEQFEEFHCRQ